MSNYLVTINLVVLNGEKYIRHCLDAVLGQSYPKEFIEVNILDNGSTDKTKEIIRDLEFRISDLGFARFNFIESKLNLGMWPGQEELLKYSDGKYILSMAVDVILDKDFIKNAVEVMEQDSKIGALQAKIYKFDLRPTSDVQRTSDVQVGTIIPTSQIDTCGFKIFKSRRVVNIGHGEPDFAAYSAEVTSTTKVEKASTGKEDNGFDFNKEQEIFGVEGACPFFRREALEDCKIKTTMGTIASNAMVPMVTEIFDHDYFWYGDDLDFAWRINLFGWKQVFAPMVIAWHDRQTTKNLRKNWLDYVLRVPTRQQIPVKKRRLDWRNTRWTIIKNDYIINILKDLPFILSREIAVFGYTLLFEPKVFLEAGNFLKLLPKMLRKRREIMKKARVLPDQMSKWFK